MKALPSETDFIVVGAGIAGLRASVELASAGRVLCLAKREVTESNTQYAQGGIAAALSDDDEVRLHLEDTLKAGDGLCNEEAARILVEEGPPRIEELIAWGTEFDRAGAKIAFTREGAHSRSRVLHAHGDSTGREIGRALYLKAAAQKAITFQRIRIHHRLAGAGWQRGWGPRTRPGWSIARDFCRRDVAGHRRVGPRLQRHHQPVRCHRRRRRHGISRRRRDQRHGVRAVPSHRALPEKCPRFLLSEALRGEGAYLRNIELKRFMPKYHEAAELAPRDVVARAIAHELELVKRPDAAVYLDLTHLKADLVRKRFPTIYSTCMQYNIDIATELVPIRPAAHYAMGGVRTDLQGQTSLPGLYAAGEVACTGVHGANRLASNSLLEGLVYGARAAHAMREHLGPRRGHAAVASAENTARHYQRTAGPDRGIHQESAIADVAVRGRSAQRKRPAAGCLGVERVAEATACLAAIVARTRPRTYCKPDC